MSRCKSEIYEKIVNKYNVITEIEFDSDFIRSISQFDYIAEEKIRTLIYDYYKTRSANQAWKSCKGALYEYAVLRAFQQILNNDQKLSKLFFVQPYKRNDRKLDQLKISNWTDITPDVDIVIVDKSTNKIKIIISCKTSLRERLTETAFWKRELEKQETTRDVKIYFVTTDKDNELRQENNRYIVLHVLDLLILTNEENYKRLIEQYKRKYYNREDFHILYDKIIYIGDLEKYLKNKFIKSMFSKILNIFGK